LRPFGDRIFALSTPPGTSAVSVIRCSGHEVLKAIGPLLVSSRGGPVQLRPGRVAVVRVRDPESEDLIDEVVALYFRGPRSYTGEDVVELQGHGSMVVVRAIFELLRKCGLRHAQPGEFSRRAFLSGRMGLTEAEGINDLIHAQTEAYARIAFDHIKGALKKTIRTLRQSLIDLTALIEANIDFPEDDIDILDRDTMRKELLEIQRTIDSLIGSYDRGRRMRDGIRISIAGRPNAGKSSLLNLLLKSERAIVSEIPGTTRDTIEESFAHAGILYRIIDTAGLRHSTDPVESIGIERAREQIFQADLILYLMDQTASSFEEDERVIEDFPSEKLILVLNKCDQPSLADGQFHSNPGPIGLSSISALTGEGVNEMLNRISELVMSTVAPRSQETILINERHKDALQDASERLESFRLAFDSDIPLDVALIDLYESTRDLGLVIGEVMTEDILDRIFEKFCIGK